MPGMPPDWSDPSPGRGLDIPGRICVDGKGRTPAVGSEGRDMFGAPPRFGRWKFGLGRCICGICMFGRCIGIEGRAIC